MKERMKEGKAGQRLTQRALRSLLSNSICVELPDLALTSELMMISDSTLLQAAAGFFPIRICFLLLFDSYRSLEIGRFWH